MAASPLAQAERSSIAAAASADASFASTWAVEAERLRQRLGAPSPALRSRAATPLGGTHVAGGGGAFASDAGGGAAAPGAVESLFRSALSVAAPPSAAPSPHGGAARGGAAPSAVASVAAAASASNAGPPPTPHLLRSLQTLADAGAAATPHGVAALADASAEARRGALSAVRREAGRLAAAVDVEAARRADAEAALAAERRAAADTATQHAAALDHLRAVVAAKDAEIAQLRLALANRPFHYGGSTAAGTAVSPRQLDRAEAVAASAVARAERAERSLAASRAVEAELSQLLLAQRRREASLPPSPVAAAAPWGVPPATATAAKRSPPRAREGRLSSTLMSALQHA